MTGPVAFAGLHMLMLRVVILWKLQFRPLLDHGLMRGTPKALKVFPLGFFFFSCLYVCSYTNHLLLLGMGWYSNIPVCNKTTKDHVLSLQRRVTYISQTNHIRKMLDNITAVTVSFTFHSKVGTMKESVYQSTLVQDRVCPCNQLT